MVSPTLLRIFPRLEFIEYSDGGWRGFVDAIELSKQLIDC